jgi:hypothetical protein
MTLEDLANLSDVIAGVGVIASLIFVGIQMRQSTIAIKAQIYENMTSGYLSFASVIMPYAKVFSKGISANNDDFNAFSSEEKLIYFSTIFCLFKHFENMHSQYLNGLIDKETWDAWSEHIRMYFHLPGVREVWWPKRKMSFIKSFRIFLDKSSMPKNSSSIVDIMKD